MLCDNKRDILFIDLICHGVPSYHLYEKYLHYLNKNYGMQTDGYFRTIFRYKPMGWREKYIYNSDSIIEYCKSQNTDPYFLAFEHGFCNSKSCYECPWREKSAADIRIGDYWHKKYADNKTGVSMVATFTDQGEAFIKKLYKYNYGKIKKEPVEDYFCCQQIKNNLRPVFWEEMLHDLSMEKDIESVVKKYIIPYEKRKKIRLMVQSFKRVMKKE